MGGSNPTHFCLLLVILAACRVAVAATAATFPWVRATPASEQWGGVESTMHCSRLL